MKADELITPGGTPTLGEIAFEETELGAQLKVAFPVADPTDVQRQRIATLSTRLEAMGAHTRRLRRRRRWTFGLAGVTLSLFAGYVEAPTVQGIWALSQMQPALKKAKSAHILTQRALPNGSMQKISEQWQFNQTWRRSIVGISQDVVDWQGYYHYDPTAQVVKVWPRDSGPYREQADQTPLAQIEDIASWSLGDTVRLVVAHNTIKGRDAHMVAIYHRKSETQEYLWIEDDSNLPLQAVTQAVGKDGIPQTLISDMDVDGVPAFNEMTPNFPQKAEVIYYEGHYEAWKQRLSNPLVRQKVGRNTMAIRNVKVNSAGDVFVLFTTDRNEKEWWAIPWDIQLQDDLGTRYIPTPLFFAASNGIHSRYIPPGFKFDGEPLMGVWWVPVNPPSAGIRRKPTQMTFTFHTRPTNTATNRLPENTASSYSGNTLPGASDNALCEMRVSGNAIEATETALVPDYMPYLDLNGLQEGDITLGAAQARADYYHHVEKAPAKALPYYQETVRLAEKYENRLRYWPGAGRAWFDLYVVYSDLGRRSEALDALRKARETTLKTPGTLGGDMRRAMEKEGI